MKDPRYAEASALIENAMAAMDAAEEAVGNLTDTEDVLGEMISLHGYGSMASYGRDYYNAVAKWRREARDAGLL
jgi:hypothetical protein